jgi:hypothetical protein
MPAIRGKTDGRTGLRRMRRRTGLLTTLALLTILASRPAVACSCAQPTPEQAFARATAVFAGRVVAIEEPFLVRLGLARAGAHDVTFAVARRWKASAGPTVTVRTRLASEACGYPFEMSGDYLVFVAPGPVEDLETGLCTGTRALAGAAADLRALDALAEGSGAAH